MKGMAIVLLMAVALAWCEEVTDTLPVLYTRFELDTAYGVPRVGEQFTLTFKGRAFYDVPPTKLLVTIPNGMFCFEDSTKYMVSCSANDSVVINIRLRADSAGPYHIQAHMLTSEAETLKLLQYYITDFYLLSQTDTAAWSMEPLNGIDEYNLVTDESDADYGRGSRHPVDNGRVYGWFRYRVRNGIETRPIRGLVVKLIPRGVGQTRTATTDEVGYYSFEGVPSGSYVFRAYAQSTDGEVHRGWQAWTGWFSGGTLRVNLSPDPHLFKEVGFTLSGEREVSYTAEGDAADWACLLDEIRKAKQTMLQESGRTLDYLEVSYPPVCTVRIRYWPIGNEDLVYDMLPGWAGGFALPADKVREAKVRADIRGDGNYRWYGISAWPHRNPYQIVVYEGCMWENVCCIYHEWSHIFQFRTLGDKVPYYLYADEHYSNSVRHPGFAFGEGFAIFQEQALHVKIKGEVPDCSQAEEFYGNRGRPWYKGDERGRNRPPEPTTHGDSVEGAVCQFFWDLFDETATPDNDPCWDDDGVSGQWRQLMQVQAAMGQEMTTEVVAWEYLGEPHLPESIGMKSSFSKLTLSEPGDIDYTGWIRDRWGEDISELHSVVVHPFSYPEPYPLATPTGLAAEGVGSNHVDLVWTDNTKNEGLFLVYHRRDGGPYEQLDTCGPSPGVGSEKHFRCLGLQPLTTYWFKVKTMTCDTSPCSDSIQVTTTEPYSWEETQSMPATPSGKAVKDGGWLSFDPGSNLIYGAKGNKTGDF